MSAILVEEILDEIASTEMQLDPVTLDRCEQVKEELAPALREILNEVIDDPERFASGEEGAGYVFAIALLVHFRDLKSHELIATLFSLPGNMPEALFFDWRVQGLASFLYFTSGGNLDRIKSLVRDSNVDPDCRASGLQALNFASVENKISRDVLISFYGSTLKASIASRSDDEITFATCLLLKALELYPVELKEVVKEAFKNKRIDDTQILLEEFEECLEFNREETFEGLKLGFEEACALTAPDYLALWERSFDDDVPLGMDESDDDIELVAMDDEEDDDMLDLDLVQIKKPSEGEEH